MSIIKNIKQLAESKGVTIPELGTKLGIGKSAVYKWDESSPKTETLQKVADYFNVSIDQLIYGYNRPLFAATLLLLKHGRTLEQFSKDTNTDPSEVKAFLDGTAPCQPSLGLIEKLVIDNPISFMLTAEEIYNHAGYDAPEHYRNQALTPLTTQTKGLDETEEELVRIYAALSIRGKAVLLSYAYELEEEENKNSQHP